MAAGPDGVAPPEIGAPGQCMLCPRRCGVNRLAGRSGWCGAGARPRVFRYGPHAGEEPVLSGSRGSGTVFFSHCTMACAYCQNFPWSQDAQGEDIDTAQLTAILDDLRASGCHNWNMVSPTPWLPWVAEAVQRSARHGRRLPVVMNSGGYERVETLEEYAGLADVYLADLRYAADATAQRVSAVTNYAQTARAALMKMHELAGPLRLDDDDMARRGVICRILVLPGHAAEALENLRWLRAALGPETGVSVMAQYLPAGRAPALGAPWNRRISREEYAGVCAEAERLDFDFCWIQEYETDTQESLIGFRMPSGRGTAGTVKELERKDKRP